MSQTETLSASPQTASGVQATTRLDSLQPMDLSSIFFRRGILPSLPLSLQSEAFKYIFKFNLKLRIFTVCYYIRKDQRGEKKWPGKGPPTSCHSRPEIEDCLFSRLSLTEGIALYGYPHTFIFCSHPQPRAWVRIKAKRNDMTMVAKAVLNFDPDNSNRSQTNSSEPTCTIAQPP